MGGLWILKSQSFDLYHAVFSGTALSFDELQEQAASMMAKTSDDPTNKETLLFAGCKMLDPEGVRNYIGQFLDLNKVDADVSDHVAKWLRGRPRWAARFLRLYLSRRAKQPEHAETNFQKEDGTLTVDGRLMETIGHYLTVMATDEKDRRTSWSAGETSAYQSFVKAQTKIAKNNLNSLSGVMGDTKNAVFKFHLGQDPHVFMDEKAKFLIENGISAVMHGT